MNQKEKKTGENKISLFKCIALHNIYIIILKMYYRHEAYTYDVQHVSAICCRVICKSVCVQE